MDSTDEGYRPQEFHGRQIVFFVSYFGLAAFSAGAAGAQNMHTLVILRFFAGAFGASPLTNAGGVIADMFDAKGKLVTSLNRRATAADDPLLQSVARRQVSLPWPPFSVPPSGP